MANLNNNDLLEFRQSGFAGIKSIITDNYGLCSEIRIRFPEVVSLTSKKIILETEQDGTKLAWFLKEKPSYSVTPVRLAMSAYYQSYLAGRESLAPSIVKTVRGRDYLRVNDRHFLLTEYLPGENYSGGSKDIFEAGRTLGRMHANSLGLDPGKFGRQGKYPTEIAEEFLDMALRDSAAPGPNSDQKHLISKIWDFLGRVSISLKKSNCRFILSHGDFNPFNLVYERESRRVRCVNDFDNTDVLLITHDLAEAVLTFAWVVYAGLASNFANRTAGRINFGYAKLITDAYLQSVELKKDEIMRLPDVVMAIWVELVSLGILRGDYGWQELEKFGSVKSSVYDFFKQYA